MTETLFVRLAEQEAAPASWMLVDAAGNPSGSVVHGPLADAAALAAGRQVTALVPGIEVLLAEPQLPVRGGSRLAQVVPFALEEHLAEDVDNLHFAIGRREAERTGTPVAAVARAQMETWLRELQAAGIEPQALYAEHSLLPANPSQSVLLIEEDRLYVRHPGQPPFVLQVEPLDTALELAGLFSEPDGETPEEDSAAAGEGSEQPHSEQPQCHVLAYVTEEAWGQYQATLEAARARLATLNIQLLPDGALPLLATQPPQPACNLRQGPFGLRTGFTDKWKRWRVAAMLLVGLIGLNLAAKGAELWRLKQTEHSLDAAIEQTFREAMPGERNAANARRRMEAQLNAARGGTGGSGAGILPMLGALGTAFPQIPGAKLQGLNFRNNVLDLRVQAADVGSLSRLESLVTGNGLEAKLQSSSNTTSGVEGNVQITSGGAP